jgi:hypothetical protein
MIVQQRTAKSAPLRAHKAVQKIIRGLKRVMIQRLDQLSMYRKQVKNRNMHTTFWKITKDLANSDVNQDMLKIFDID